MCRREFACEICAYLQPQTQFVPVTPLAGIPRGCSSKFPTCWRHATPTQSSVTDVACWATSTLRRRVAVSGLTLLAAIGQILLSAYTNATTARSRPCEAGARWDIPDPAAVGRYAGCASRVTLSLARSFRLARRMAGASSGAVIAEKPGGAGPWQAPKAVSGRALGGRLRRRGGGWGRRRSSAGAGRS
jgi:hypothetical protein